MSGDTDGQSSPVGPKGASYAHSNAPSTIPDSAIGILDCVAQPDGWTKWSIVYVPKQGTVYCRTAAMPKVKSVRFDAFALGCPSPRKYWTSPNSGSAGGGPNLAGAAGSAAAVLGTAGSPSTTTLGNAGGLAVAPGKAGSAPYPLSAGGSGGEQIDAATPGGAPAVQSKKSDDSGCGIHAPRSGSYGQYCVVLGLAMLICRHRARMAKRL